MSNPIQHISKIKGQVEEMLKKHSRLRDDDAALIANLWNLQLMGEGINVWDISAAKLLEKFAKGQMMNAETIRRCRQKLQEKHPELRGEKYEDRQAEEKKVRKQIVNE